MFAENGLLLLGCGRIRGAEDEEAAGVHQPHRGSRPGCAANQPPFRPGVQGHADIVRRGLLHTTELATPYWSGRPRQRPPCPLRGLTNASRLDVPLLTDAFLPALPSIGGGKLKAARGAPLPAPVELGTRRSLQDGGERHRSGAPRSRGPREDEALSYPTYK